MHNPNAFRHGHDICAYCGMSPAPEKEHVIARAFFAEPFPENLIQVASCTNCNHGEHSALNNDEDYVASLMLHSSYVMHHPAAAARRAGPYQRAVDTNQGEPAKMQHAGRFIEVFDNDGRHAGYGRGTLIDRPRVNRVITKIVRGLYYHEIGAVLPDDCQIDVIGLLDNGGWPRLDEFIEIAEMVKCTPGWVHLPVRQFAGDVFTYWAVLNPADPSSEWFLAFYNGAFPVRVIVQADNGAA